jgi:hypothetical protein
MNGQLDVVASLARFSAWAVFRTRAVRHGARVPARERKHSPTSWIQDTKKCSTQ